MKNFNDNFGNRNHDLPACSVVFQPNVSLPALGVTVIKYKSWGQDCIYCYNIFTSLLGETE